MADLLHECGVAALYHLPGAASPLIPNGELRQTSHLMPRMLLDLQNRGQLQPLVSALSIPSAIKSSRPIRKSGR